MARAGKAATAVTRQVVALVAEPFRAVATRVVGDKAPTDCHRVEVQEAAAVGGRVVGKGAVADARPAGAEEPPAAAPPRAAAKVAVADSHFATHPANPPP